MVVLKYTRGVLMLRFFFGWSHVCSYYRVFKDVRKVLAEDTIIVSEGANTMDIGRTLMPNFFPRHRLDAGTFGTMGVGLGFAIAAAIVYPHKQVRT